MSITIYSRIPLTKVILDLELLYTNTLLINNKISDVNQDIEWDNILITEDVTPDYFKHIYSKHSEKEYNWILMHKEESEYALPYGVEREDVFIKTPMYEEKLTQEPLIEIQSYPNYYIDGKRIDTSEFEGVQAEMLLWLLIFNFNKSKSTLRSEIFEILWPDLSKNMATNIFHVQKRKLSKIFGKIIDFQGNQRGYAFLKKENIILENSSENPNAYRGLIERAKKYPHIIELINLISKGEDNK